MLSRRSLYIVVVLVLGLLFTSLGIGMQAVAQSPVPVASSPFDSTAGAVLPVPLPPGPPIITLYDQYNWPGTLSYSSQNFEASFDTYDSYLADDFTVPAGQTWSLTQVDVLGEYFNGTGPADSFNVYFFTETGAFPGNSVISTLYIPYTEVNKNFSIPIDPVVTLPPGKYWISVQANLNFNPGGQWGWAGRSVTTFHPAAWKNPGGAFGYCPEWATRATCTGGPEQPDQVFRLLGRVNFQKCSIPSHWAIRTTMPNAVYALTSATNGKDAYIFGGFDIGNSREITQTLRYDPLKITWTPLAPAPHAISMASTIYSASNNKIYVFGGENISTGEVYNTTLIYDIPGNSWSTGASMPDKRAFMASGFFNGKVYLVGGYNTGSVDPSFAETWEYNIATNTWATLADMPVTLGGAASAVVNGKMYVMGGRNFDNQSMTTNYIYDIAANTWSQGSFVPYGINVAAGVVVDGKIWVIGGGTPFLGSDGIEITLNSSAPETIKTTLIYDPASDTYSNGPALNVQRSFPSALYLKNRLLVFGGYNGTTSTASVEEMGTCWSYMPLLKGKPAAK